MQFGDIVSYANILYHIVIVQTSFDLRLSAAQISFKNLEIFNALCWVK